MSFKDRLQKEIRSCKGNNFGEPNFDKHRFGEFRSPFSYDVKRFLKKISGYEAFVFREFEKDPLKGLKAYEADLEFLFEKLNDRDKNLLVKLIAYRKLGFRKVQLPTNNAGYWASFDKVDKLKDSKDRLDPHFKHFVLEKFSLQQLGYDISMYYRSPGVVTDFVLEQYAYKEKGSPIVQADKGDVVIDAGGCWGDTALYFADKVGEHGSVYSFEFIPNNIKIFEQNVSLNPHLKNRIHLVPNPLSNVSDVPVYYFDNGPGSKVSMKPFSEQTGQTMTSTIDDFVLRNNISKVDMIKMDIEGAELPALEGALNTIRTFKPKLAIAIYHSMNDLVSIPKWILEQKLGYQVFIDHFTIHAEETICFAKIR